jgi:hypothetical protein
MVDASDLHRRLGAADAAIADYDRALGLVGNDVQRRYLAGAPRSAYSSTDTRRADAAMPRAENIVAVNRPAQEVFDYLADGTHNTEDRHAESPSRSSPALAADGCLRVDPDRCGDNDGTVHIRADASRADETDVADDRRS